jgi:hypothetical protein
LAIAAPSCASVPLRRLWSRGQQALAELVVDAHFDGQQLLFPVDLHDVGQQLASAVLKLPQRRFFSYSSG